MAYHLVNSAVIDCAFDAVPQLIVALDAQFDSIRGRAVPNGMDARHAASYEDMPMLGRRSHGGVP